MEGLKIEISRNIHALNRSLKYQSILFNQAKYLSGQKGVPSDKTSQDSTIERQIESLTQKRASHYTIQSKNFKGLLENSAMSSKGNEILIRKFKKYQDISDEIKDQFHSISLQSP